MPALETTISSPPSITTAKVNISETEAGVATSQTVGSTRTPGGALARSLSAARFSSAAFRAQSTTEHPSRTYDSATASPKPWLAPVMIARLLISFIDSPFVNNSDVSMYHGINIKHESWAPD